MHDIFLSYASEDRARASQLATALGKQGWEVWWDRTILPGKSFDRVIESELNAATCVIVLWSKISVESQWVRAEAGDALNKDRLIPALLEDAEIPLVFRQIQAASLLDWAGDPGHAGFIQLTRAITAFVSPALPNDTNPALGETTGKLKTAAPKSPDRQPDALRESRQISGQSSSRNRFTSLLWPATTISALLIAGLAVYLYWQKPTIHETQVTLAPATDPVHKIKPPKQEEPKQAEPKQVEPKQAEPKQVEPKQAEPKQAEPKIVQPTPAPALIQKPAQKTNPVARRRPGVPQKDTTATRSAKTMLAKPDVPTSPPAPLKILMVVWGTPNDDGLASSSQTRDYSSNLAQLMTGIVETSIQRPIAFDYHYIENRDHHSLMRDKPEFNKSAALCSEMNVDLVLFGFMEGSEFDMTIGYVPSRQPFFLVFDCKAAKGTAKRFWVTETRDDSFPYEKSLIRAFRSFSQQTLITDLNTKANRVSVE